VELKEKNRYKELEKVDLNDMMQTAGKEIKIMKQ
jgi:hypothetical protein